MQRAAIWWFGALLLAAIPAFWPGYFGAPPFRDDFLHVHLHGVAMFAWVALLLVQAALIRARRRPLHRALGKVSYGLVPLIVVSTLLLANFRLRQQSPPPYELVYFFYVQLSLVAVFTVAWTLAMVHRRAPALHMRYIAGATLALVDPILARLLAMHAGVQPPLLQALTYGFVMALLAALWWRDRHTPHSRAYRTLFALFSLAVGPTFFLPQTAAWRSFTEAFARLPLP